MPGKKNKIRVAVLGCGRIAWLGFLPWIKEHSGATLAAVADHSEEQAKRAARAFGAESWHTDFDEMMDRARPDALCVLTPPWAHAEPVIAAAGRGVHVLCEKPMAPNAEDCRRMIEACDKNGVRLQIGFSLRFDPGYEKLKVMVKTGEIGDVYQMKSEYDIWVPDLTRSPMKELVEIGGKLNLFNSADMGAWRMNDTRSGGGVFCDHGVHYVDLFRWILDDDVEQVMGTRHTISPNVAFEDHASCMARFRSGVCAHIEASLCRWSARDEIDQGIIYGSRGDIKYKMDQSWYALGFPKLNNVHARLWKYGTASLALGAWLPAHVPHGRKYVLFKRQMNYFIDTISGTLKPHPVFGDEWAATGRDGLRSVEIKQAVYDSAEQKRAVSFDIY